MKWWLTFNEPWVVTVLGYDTGVFAPGVYSPGVGSYRAAHTIIKAHAEAWHLYNQTHRANQNGDQFVDCENVRIHAYVELRRMLAQCVS